MPGPPGNGRELPGLVLKDRGASFLQNQREARQNLMANNRYNVLRDGDDGQSNMDTTVTVKVKKPPPIELATLKLSEIQKKIKNCQNLTCDVQYRISVTTIEDKVRETVKIYAQNNQDFTVIKNHLNTNNIEYSTHPLHDDKQVKICMYGLNEVNTADLKSEIGKFVKTKDESKSNDKFFLHVGPSEIKMITPRKGFIGESRIYILYFKKSDKIKVADLRNAINGLFNIRVRFEYYSPRKFGPTQCTNCQDFGHGTASCHRASKCVRCGGNHASKSCIFLPVGEEKQETKPKIAENLVKCANCGGKHTANYAKCVYRKNVIAKQQQFKPLQKRQEFSYQDYDFPELIPTQTETHPRINNKFSWSNITQQQQPQQSTMEAMQRFLDAQNSMAQMMNQMMSQMTTMLATINQMLDKITQIATNHD